MRKLLGNTKSKINKDKMVNVTHLETTEVVLVHCRNYWTSISTV